MLALELCRRSGQSARGSWVQLSSGPMGDVWRNGDLVVKCHAAPPAGLFAAEAEGLKALSAHGVRTPKTHYVESSGLVMDYLTAGPSRPADLAEQLALLHRPQTHPQYGWQTDVYLGYFHLGSGVLGTHWTSFWKQHRIEPLLKVTAGHLGELLPRVWRLLERIEVPVEGPCLLHGDLWSGNVLMNHEGAWFIDPSVWYGERGVDLAMMQLFGGFPTRFWEHYHTLMPVPREVMDVLPYYQLYYVLVHVHFFGTGYCKQVRQILEHYGV